MASVAINYFSKKAVSPSSKYKHVTELGVSHLISLLCNDKKVKSNFEDMKGALILALSNDI